MFSDEEEEKNSDMEQSYDKKKQLKKDEEAKLQQKNTTEMTIIKQNKEPISTVKAAKNDQKQNQKRKKSTSYEESSDEESKHNKKSNSKSSDDSYDDNKKVNKGYQNTFGKKSEDQVVKQQNNQSKHNKPIQPAENQNVQRKISNMSGGQQNLNLKINPIVNKKQPAQPQKRYGGYNDEDDDDDEEEVQDNKSRENISQISHPIKLQQKQQVFHDDDDEEESYDDNYSNRGKRAIEKKPSEQSNKFNQFQQSPQFIQQNNKYEEKKTAVTSTNNPPSVFKQQQKKSSQNQQKIYDEDEDESMTDKSIEIMDSYSDNKSAQSRPAKGFTKQKAIEVHNMDDDQENFDEDEGDNNLDTNPENRLIEKDHHHKKRMSTKVENFFKFDYEEGEIPDRIYHFEEHGLEWKELDELNQYFQTKKLKHMKRRRKSMKYLRARNLFFISRWYMVFHFIQNVLFWMVVLVFPTISVIGCDGGHKWMSHVAMAFYLGLFLIFDTVFACQYISRESARFDLKSYNKGKYLRNGKCCFMLTVYLKCIFEILMTQIGLFDIYTDMAFATLVQKAGYSDLALVSIFSLVLIAIPKLYSFILLLMMLFGSVREQDKKRKYAMRIMIFNEFRMQAACIDYITHQKAKTDLYYGLYKLFLQDVPQFVVQSIFLVNTDCGKKYPNGIVYAGILMALFNTYFGILYRFARFCYSRKRLLSYQKKVEIKISNLNLSAYGFRNIRGKIHYNRKAQSLVFTGQNYEYMALDEQGIKKYVSFMEAFPKKDRIEFVDLNKMKFDNIRYVKQLFQGLDKNFKELRYMTIQQCFLSKFFAFQLKNFLDGNDSLARLSLIMNKMPEDDIYWTLETCLEHPNLEILQIAERWVKSITNEDAKSDKEKAFLERPTNISICRGIYIRLQQNEALKVLEIRYLELSRNVIQAIFKGLSKNKHLIRLVLTNNALKNANRHEYQLLGEALKVNQALKHIDLSHNDILEEDNIMNTEITEPLANTPQSPLQRIDVTSTSHEIMATYLGLMDQNPNICVFVNGKFLEDVDIQDDD